MIGANSENRTHIYGLEDRYNNRYTMLAIFPDWNEDFYPDLFNMM